MPQIRHVAKALEKHVTNHRKKINWFPGHMYSGMQAMIGKLNTVDCIVEVHDARLPFTGRNEDFKKHLGSIKPRLLVLNKSDLADLSNWDSVKQRLAQQGDKDVILTDSTGSQFNFRERGYTRILNNVVRLISRSDRHNRQFAEFYRIMVVGIPNVGKSTIINRLRQHHMGVKGNPAETSAEAGFTKCVHNMIRICHRPTIYSLDTPGVLVPGMTKDNDCSMRLALCSSINDKVLDPIDLAEYLLKYLHKTDNPTYTYHYKLKKPVSSLKELADLIAEKDERFRIKLITSDANQEQKPDLEKICWNFVRCFRKGIFGKVMFV